MTTPHVRAGWEPTPPKGNTMTDTHKRHVALLARIAREVAEAQRTGRDRFPRKRYNLYRSCREGAFESPNSFAPPSRRSLRKIS